MPILLAPAEREAIRAARATWGGESLKGAGYPSWLGALGRLVPPPAPFLNPVSGRNLARLDGRLRAAAGEALLLDLGSGTGGAGLGRLDRDLRERRSVHLDIEPFPGVDAVGLGSRLPFRDGTFDAVLLKAVIEHVPDAPAVIAQARRVLRPGGVLYVEVPFLFEYHPNPGDYRRYTRAGLEQALAGFEDVEVGTLVGPWAALASLLAQTLALTLSGRSRLLRRALHPFLTWLVWPLALPDLLVTGHPGSHFAAHHLYAFATRPGADDGR